MPPCNNCGKCCFYPTGNKNAGGSNELKACINLVKLNEQRYVCRIYKNRLGFHIGTDNTGKKYYCTMYNSLDNEITGCPMNMGDKPLRNVYILTRKIAKQDMVTK